LASLCFNRWAEITLTENIHWLAAPLFLSPAEIGHTEFLIRSSVLITVDRMNRTQSVARVRLPDRRRAQFAE
jgi:hypothetical protein